MLERLTDWTEIQTCCMGSERMLDDDLGAVVVLQLMYVSRSLKKSVVCLCVADTTLQTLWCDFFFLPSCVWNLMSKQQWWWSTSGLCLLRWIWGCDMELSYFSCILSVLNFLLTDIHQHRLSTEDAFSHRRDPAEVSLISRTAPEPPFFSSPAFKQENSLFHTVFSVFSHVVL